MPSAAAGVLELLVSTDGGEALLARLPLGAGQVLFWAPWLDIRNARAARLEEKGANYSLRNWSYFNYWLYRIEADAAKAAPLDFHEWPGAPVPHPRTFPTILALFGGMFAVNLAAFVVVRRYSVRHPELLRQFYARASATGSGREGPRPSTGPSDGDAGGPRAGFGRGPVQVAGPAAGRRVEHNRG